MISTFKLAIDCLKVSCRGDFQRALGGNPHSITTRYGWLQMESNSIEFAVDSKRKLRDCLDPLIMLDGQFYVMNMRITEGIALTDRVGNNFGDFGVLPESIFLAFLLYLDVVELQAVKAAMLSEAHPSGGKVEMSGPLLSWTITSSIVRAFRHQANARCSSPNTAEIPLLIETKRDSYATIPPATTSTACFSLVFSNYMMKSDEHFDEVVLAASMESFDIALSTSSILLIASVSAASCCSCRRCDHATRERTERHKPSAKQQYRLANIAEMEVSVAIRSQRLVLINSTTDDENAFGKDPVVLSFDFISSSSSSWNDLWLERFRYSPFNAQALPSHLELICRPGHQNRNKQRQVSFHLSKLEFSIIEWQSDRNADQAFGLERLLRVSIKSKHVVIGPCNATCEIIAEPKVQKWAISLTKVRIQAEKHHFDRIVVQMSTLLAAANCARRSFVVHGTTRSSSSPTCDTKQMAIAMDLAVDGVLITLGQCIRSRLGHIGWRHSNVTHSGSFYMQNFVIGHCISNVENLIIGPLSDPVLWQNDVSNYFGKLVSGQWSLLEITQNGSNSSSRLVCVDVQSFQLHLSATFLQILTEFLAVPLPKSTFQVVPQIQKTTPTPFEFASEKISWKFLILPSILSFTGERSASDQWAVAPRIWLSFGQGFVTLSLNDTTSNRASTQRKHSPLYRFLPYEWMNVIVNVEKICIRVVEKAPIVQSVLPIQQTDTQTSSWPQFWALIRSANTCTKYDVIEEFSARGVGHCVVVLEKHFYEQTYSLTSCTSLTAIVDAGSIKCRASQYTLRALLLLSVNPLRTKDQSAPKAHIRTEREPLSIDQSTDDLNDLARIIKPHDHPSPGELVLKESLTVETGNVYIQQPTSSISQYRIRTHLASNSQYEVSQLIENANQDAWNVEDHANGWMSMHWSYHLPRTVDEIIVLPVPHPPTGLPSGWPTAQYDREADLLCQIRYWNYDRGLYELVGHFYIPWGTHDEYISHTNDEQYDPQENEDDDLDLTNQIRHVIIQHAPASDRWEVRWRSPLIEDKEQEKRLTISALVASSIQVKSRLAMNAYKTLSIQICPIEIIGSICHYTFEKYSHDIVVFKALEMRLRLDQMSTEASTQIRTTFHLQIAMENIAQLATISLLSPCKLDLQTRHSASGLVLTFQMDPASIFLTQNAILMAAYLTDMCASLGQPRDDIAITSPKDTLLLPEMRIVLVNNVGQAVWYRQEGSNEQLRLDAGKSTAYSWAQLDLPFCMEFSLDTSEKLWSEPCRIKHSAVTGRKLTKHGFLWVSHQLCKRQSIVTLHPTLTIRNHLKIPIRVAAKDFQCQISADARQCAMAKNLLDVSITSSDCPETKILVSLEGQAIFPAPLDPYYPTRDQTLVDIGVLRDNSAGVVHVGVHLSRTIKHATTDTYLGLRYTWLVLEVVPAFSITNELCHPILASLRDTTSEEDKEAHVCIPQGQTQIDTSVTPRQPSQLSVKWTDASMSINVALPGFHKDIDETILSKGYRIQISTIASKSTNTESRRALVVIRIRNNLFVQNDSSQAIRLQLCALSEYRQMESIALDANANGSLPCELRDHRILIRLGQTEDSDRDDCVWSTEIELLLGGPARICQVRAGSSFMSTFFVKLEGVSEMPSLRIRPSIVVFDHTVR